MRHVAHTFRPCFAMSPQGNQSSTKLAQWAANRRNGQSAAVDAHVRPCDFLSLGEIEPLIAGAKASRAPERNQMLILMLFRHGLRVSEALGLRWHHLNLDEARIWVKHLKGSLPTAHPIAGDELRLIRRYRRTRTDALPGGLRLRSRAADDPVHHAVHCRAGCGLR
jgi:integrase